MARTTDIHSSLAACSEPLGMVEPLSRGQLNWLMTIPSDGSLPFNGMAPTLIEWHTEAHIATKLHDESRRFYDMEQREIDSYLVKIFD